MSYTKSQVGMYMVLLLIELLLIISRALEHIL
jgi:hypothetical protein